MNADKSKMLGVAALVGALGCGAGSVDDAGAEPSGFTGAGSGTEAGAPIDSAGDGDPGDGDPGDGDPGDGDPGDGDPGDGDPGDGDLGDGDPGDGDPGDGGPGDVIPCDVPTVTLAPVVPHVMLVLDKSGSMIEHTWDHDADPGTPEVTRWRSLHSVVSQLVTSFDAQFEFGAQLFPSMAATNAYDASACLVASPPEVASAPANATAVLLGIPIGGSQNLRGGTPAAAGLSSAIDHLVGKDDGDPAALILVTDGAANCRTDAVSEAARFESYDPNLLGIVAGAYTELGIPTYVVGIDISAAVTPITGEANHPPDGEPDGISPDAELDALAIAGGRPLAGPVRYYQTQNELELAAAIQAIVDDAASCTVSLDPVPPFPDLVEVVVDGVSVPRVDDCEAGDGWAFVDPDGPFTELVLCGSYCEGLADADELLAEYYCNPG